jgi:alanine dehydrogenase
MIIGVPKEIKDHETRVGLVPSGVTALREAGHEVLVEAHAGEGSSSPTRNTCRPARDPRERGGGLAAQGRPGRQGQRAAARRVRLLPPRPDPVHLSAPGAAARTDRPLLAAKVSGVAYETIRERDGSLPLLTPMSEVAGRMSVQVGAQYLEKPNGGRGILLGGVPGVAPANVVILGGGIVGTNAAKIAIGMGAHVTIIDRNLNRLRELDDIFNGQVVTLASNAWTIGENLKTADLVVGAVLIPGASAPKLVRAR